MKNCWRLADWIWISGLPRGKDLGNWRPKSLIDLTQRELTTVRRSCEKYGIEYLKRPITYDMEGAENAVESVLTAKTPVLVHCFNGRDRAPVVCRRAIMRRQGEVVLHGVGRNLARSYRLCASFGIPTLKTHECTGQLAGNLYSAADTVIARSIDVLPDPSQETIWLDQSGSIRLRDVDWLSVRRIVVGGESCGLPPGGGDRVRIDHQNKLELTVESALAIALYAWSWA